MKRGFTLIELLVVISIISLLSSIVLASLSQAKVKATNAVISSTIVQYRTALEEYAIDHDQYPYSGWSTGVSTNSWVCLGTYSNGCGSMGNPFGVHIYDQNTPLQNGLLEYYPAFPAVGSSPFSSGNNGSWLGALYACGPNTIVYDNNNNKVGCKQIYIQWHLQGDTPSCGLGTMTESSPVDITCQLILSQS